MQITLPDIDIDPKWTIPGQLKKIFEEAGEVAEAVANIEYEEAIKEALDTMQTCATLINMILTDDDPDELPRYLKEHTEKLLRKGYVKVKQPVEIDDDCVF